MHFGVFGDSVKNTADTVVQAVQDGAQMLKDGVVNFVRDPVDGVKRGFTAPAKLYGDLICHESSIIDTATGIFKDADDNSRRGLVDEVLRRSPGLINPGTLLEAGKSLICGTISEQIKTRPVNSLINDVIQCSLELLGSAVDLVKPDLLLKTVENMSRAILRALITTVGELPFIKDAIFSNDINAATLGLIWSNGADLASFFVDLAECTKCYVSNTSRDGAAVPNNPHGEDNELDFSKAMNRHAAICQLQRLAQSIIFILKEMRKSVDMRKMDDFELIGMTQATTLRSDVELGAIIAVPLEAVLGERSGEQPVKQGVKRAVEWAGKESENKAGKRPATEPEVPPVDHINGPKGGQPEPSTGGQSDVPRTEQTDETPGGQQPQDTRNVINEKWLFVNGVAGEYHWTRLACERLTKIYSRDTTGILNRGDGILWDLVECAGERSAQGGGKARSQKRLIKRTESSRKAQEVLKKQLEQALGQTLETENGETSAHIVMIAHSQGCLLLRLALEELVKDAELNFLETMQKRLCVFTFGNPSVDWKLDDRVKIKYPLTAQDCEFCAKKLAEEEEKKEKDKNDKDCRHLSSYILRTEHFANSVDFVAKLGVLSKSIPTDSGYDCVFINGKKDWIGHLFGSQYSLNPKDYGTKSRQKSWLLACKGGESMKNVI
ncbi:hypothetical protein H2201_008234, partial [Coniosporium apollinis]